MTAQGELLPGIRKGAQLEGDKRWLVWRIWDNRLPLAAWLMCNPSLMNANDDDPTGRRVTGFTRDHGCGGWFGVNVWPYITPYPEKLWERMARDGYLEADRERNLDFICQAGADARLRFAAFGCEPCRRYPEEVRLAVDAFEVPPGRVMSLGCNPDGFPLHPLARGKFAIPKGTPGRSWSWPE